MSSASTTRLDDRPVITFYSYKGGVGRSMALANLAVLLARDYRRDVIVVDWDLEAPGLHRFFGKSDADVTDGVIDYLHRYKDALRKPDARITEGDLALEPALIPVRRFDGGGRVRLLGAGNLTDHAAYVRRVSTFDWDDFYREWQGAQLVELMRRQLKQLAAVTLVDSRTGITDVGGVCTVQLPDVVVFVFSFNEQNIHGTERIARDLTIDHPMLKELGRQPKVLLLPSRKELGEIERLRQWEKIADERLGGYVTVDRVRRRFPDTLTYLREIAVPYVPYFAYGEELAAETDKGIEQVISYSLLAELAVGDRPVATVAATAGARKLVVCCDGTWNTPRTESNILRTYRFLRERLGAPAEVTQKEGVVTCAGRAQDGSDVLLFYDQGVGTDWFTRLVGGGAGVGLSDGVRDAYHFLGQNFVPGSEIYVFGFSRGAYTARSLCAFIKAAGLLDKPSIKDVWSAYMDHYATASGVIASPQGWAVDHVLGWQKQRATEEVGRLGGAVSSLPRHAGVKIRFLGVYDTVGALGVPIPAMVHVNEPVFGLHDTTLGDNVEHAVQALAADERRGPYVPSLWTRSAPADTVAGQSVLQVWFPGVHSDIGGGYRDKGIGDITWDFMMRQAADRGLVIDPGLRTPPVTLESLPAQHESFSETWQQISAELKLIPMHVREIGSAVVGPDGREVRVAGRALLHPSLVSRLGKQCTTILDEAKNQRVEGEYRPPNVKPDILPVFA